MEPAMSTTTFVQGIYRKMGIKPAVTKQQLEELGEYYEYKIQRNILAVQIKDVTIRYRRRTYRLGTYQLEISDNLWVCKVFKLPKTKYKGKYIHPHCNSVNNICTGEGFYALGALIRLGYLCDIVFMIERILNTYNASTAYTTLERIYDDIRKISSTV